MLSVFRNHEIFILLTLARCVLRVQTEVFKLSG